MTSLRKAGSHHSPADRLDRLARQATKPLRPAKTEPAVAANIDARLQSERGRRELRALLHAIADRMIDRRDTAAIAAAIRTSVLPPGRPWRSAAVDGL
jgi:hypothetical protein